MTISSFICEGDRNGFAIKLASAFFRRVMEDRSLGEKQKNFQLVFGTKPLNKTCIFKKLLQIKIETCKTIELTHTHTHTQTQYSYGRKKVILMHESYLELNKTFVVITN